MQVALLSRSSRHVASLEASSSSFKPYLLPRGPRGVLSAIPRYSYTYSNGSHNYRLSRCTPRCRAGLTSAVQDLLATSVQPHPGLPAGLFVNSTVFLLGLKILLQGLTPAGVANSWVLGTAVYSAFGPGGYVLVCVYFLLGSAVTKVKLKQKQQEGIAEQRSGRRSPGSVWGSGSAGTACALAALLLGNAAFWQNSSLPTKSNLSADSSVAKRIAGFFLNMLMHHQVGFVASFVSKFSDTVSSEIGKAYGKTAYLVTTLQTVPRGTEGAVSLEGTAAGVAAAALFSAIALALNLVTPVGVIAVASAAVVANLFESFLGATLQEKALWLSNDVVNGIQIFLAAGIALVITPKF